MLGVRLWVVITGGILGIGTPFTRDDGIVSVLYRCVQWVLFGVCRGVRVNFGNCGGGYWVVGSGGGFMEVVASDGSEKEGGCGF